MKKTRRDSEERRYAGSSKRDAKHRPGGDWTTLNLPAGLEIFSPKEGKYRFDIVPFKAGKGNEYAEPGEWYYERTFWRHRQIGPKKQSFICLKETAGKPCPICDHAAKLARDPKVENSEVINALRAQERQVFLVHMVPADKGEDTGQVLLFEQAHNNFGALLDDRRRTADEGETHIVNFDDGSAGATLKVVFKQKDTGMFKYLAAQSIDFIPRPRGLSDELLNHGYCPDAMLNLMDYDELNAILLQTSFDDLAKAKAPEDKKKKPPRDDDDEDEEEEEEEGGDEEEPPTAADLGFKVGSVVKHRKFGLCEVVHISGDGSSMKLKDAEAGVHHAIAPDECVAAKGPMPAPKDGDDEEEEEEAPPKKRGRKPAKEEEEEEEEEPAPRRGKATPKRRPADDDDDDEEEADDDDDDDEEEEEEEPEED